MSFFLIRHFKENGLYRSVSAQRPGCVGRAYRVTDMPISGHMIATANATTAGAQEGSEASERVIVGVEANKPDAVEHLRAGVPGGLPVSVEMLRVKYPQGAEKMLISALLGREVPSGGLPVDVRAMCGNGATTAETKRYMDFAAEYGFDGVLVEGWNVGWDGDWFHNGDLFSFTEAYPDFDLAAIAAYGEQRGVRLIGHHETSGNVSNYAAQTDAAFDLYATHGVRQVKTGYVADAGDIKRVDEDGLVHYEWHDGQFMAGEYLKPVTEAAKRKISINTHEPIKDTGERRTYPNMMSREGARGQEYNAWAGDGGNPGTCRQRDGGGDRPGSGC